MRCGLLVCVLIAALLVACGGNSGKEPSPSNGVARQAVTYRTEEGEQLQAQLTLPEGVAKAPLVILLHQYRGSPSQWDPLINDLDAAGYATLAPEVNGFQGDGCADRGARPHCRLELAAALEYAATRDDIDKDRLAIVGASMGGNLAVVGTEVFDSVDTAVALSPVMDPRGDELLGRDIGNYAPHSVLFMSDAQEAPAARQLSQAVAPPVEVKVYDDGNAHGVELLGKPVVTSDILAWLGEELR